MKPKTGLSAIAFFLTAVLLLSITAYAAQTATEPYKLILKRDYLNIGVGESDSIYFMIKNADKFQRKLSFSSTDRKVLDIGKNGKFKGLKTGKADIIISEYREIHAIDTKTGMDAVSASVNILGVISVTVGKAPDSINLNAGNLALGIGEKFDLNAYAVNGMAYRRTFTSSDERIAKVDTSGIITPVKTGKVKITAKIYNGKTRSCVVTVTKKPTKIAITNRNALIQKGSDVHRITYKVSGSSLKVTPAFSVGNKKIAKVGKDGTVTGVANGKTYVKLKTDYDNIYAVQKIEVVDNALPLNRNCAQRALDCTNVRRVEYGESSQGRKLEAYVITNRQTGKYDKTLFMDFAVHGFEDSYYRDGKVLVNEANRIIMYYSAHSELLKNYRLVIVPCANPDGTIAGKNNYRAQSNAFGRCTAEHIDMNRDFISFNAVESKRLKSLILKSKPDVYLNMHGWYDETIGTKALNGIIMNTQDFTTRKDGRYGANDGYIIAYVHNTLDIPSALVEYKAPDKVSLNRDVKMINEIVEYFN